MAFVARHPRNIPAGYYKPIGQIISRWTYTELYLQSIIWHVWSIKDPKVARLLTWDLGAASKVDLFKLLAPRWLRNAADQTELRGIASEANRLRDKRNLFAHGVWSYRLGTRKQVFLVRARGSSRILPKATAVSLHQMRDWARELDALNLRLTRFHKHLGAPAP